MSVSEVVDEVLKYDCRFVVLTGGEPMVARGIRDLASALHNAGLHITIETAGTIPPAGIACDLASVSPKLTNSTPHEGSIEAAWITRHDSTRIQPDVIRQWIALPDYQLKFVVSEPHDLDEIQTLLTSVNDEIPPHRIQIMPEGTTREILHHRQLEWVEICKRQGYRLIHRLHVDLFGHTRGT